MSTFGRRRGGAGRMPAMCAKAEQAAPPEARLDRAPGQARACALRRCALRRCALRRRRLLLAARALHAGKRRGSRRLALRVQRDGHQHRALARLRWLLPAWEAAEAALAASQQRAASKGVGGVHPWLLLCDLEKR